MTEQVNESAPAGKVALLALADRCEAATGADWELDKAIQRWRDPEHVAHMEREAAEMRDTLRERGLWEARGHIVEEHVNTSPRFTASLDAAMTLAEALSGFVWCRQDWWPKLDRPATASVTYGPEGETGTRCGRGATPALALCAASLRARATGENA